MFSRRSVLAVEGRRLNVLAGRVARRGLARLGRMGAMVEGEQGAAPAAR
jgi:hypothetical protein